MNLSEIAEAISLKKQITFFYKGNKRIVDPYLVGINTKNNTMLSAYQVDGYSDTGHLPNWRLFNINQISGVEILDSTFMTNPMYNPNDKRMIAILHRLEL